MQTKNDEIHFLRRSIGLAAQGLRIAPTLCRQCLDIVGKYPEVPMESTRRVLMFMATSGVVPSPVIGAKARSEVEVLRAQFAPVNVLRPVAESFSLDAMSPRG